MQLRLEKLSAGGLMFGWNALALTLKGQDMYATGCAAEREGERLLFFFTLCLLYDSGHLTTLRCAHSIEHWPACLQ